MAKESKLKLIDASTEESQVTKTMLVQSKNSDRGLGHVGFLDKYHQVCSIQDSSAASEACIWLGIESTGPHITGPSGKNDEKINARMHLTQAMVKQLLPILQEFAETGEYIANMKVKKD